MNIRIKRIVLLATALANITPQSTICSSYLPSLPDWAQQYWSRYTPSKETVYSYINPYQYSPYQLAAGLAALGVLSSGLYYYLNYVIPQQEVLRKQLEETKKNQKYIDNIKGEIAKLKDVNGIDILPWLNNIFMRVNQELARKKIHSGSLKNQVDFAIILMVKNLLLINDDDKKKERLKTELKSLSLSDLAIRYYSNLDQIGEKLVEQHKLLQN